MKKKIHLSSSIFLINKKFKENEYYHYIQDPDNVITIPVLKNNLKKKGYKGKFIIPLPIPRIEN